MPKRTKAVDVTGRWSSDGNKIFKYELIPKNTKCSKCQGTDENCPICHGSSVKKPLKWFHFIKKFEKWLEN